MENTEDSYVLFGPRNGKSIKRLYPEIAEDPMFRDISDADIYFAWLIGIPGSPVDENLKEPIRYKSAASKAYGNNPEKRDSYALNVNIPDNIKAAINKFSSFSPEARMLAKKMTQTAFMKLQEMVNIDVKEDFMYKDKDGNDLIDWSGRKSFVDSIHKMTETIPILIKQMEEGFGVPDSKKTEGYVGKKSIEKYHETKKDKTQ